MRQQGLSDKEIADGMGMTIREMKARYSVAWTENRQGHVAEAHRLLEQGLSKQQIADRFGVNESTVRSWLNRDISERQKITMSTVDVLKKEVDKSKYIDVGSGVAESMGISSSRLDTAVQYLSDKGYEVHKIQVPQVGNPDQKTTVKVLCKPGTTWRDVYMHKDDIGIVNARFANPQGRSVLGLEPVKSISSKRIEVSYLEDGGIHKDGVIELRRGVDGLSLGDANYAQVRIGVDGTHFLKGMAVYSDNLPEGIDIRFNTNKSKNDPAIKSKLDVFKPMKTDQNGNIIEANPFGAVIKPGGQKGYINIVREEGDWSRWKNTIASQFLSKQPLSLASKQLNLTQEIRRQEFDEIKSLTNPIVKKHLLEQFADGCDSDSVFLKAAAMPRQGSHVILPLDTIKPNQIYAPGYRDGERVVLIRYPHGGTFEIPELIVNNKNREGRRLFPSAQDAVGIHHSVAERLSGADFDGDTVLVIPNNKKRIVSTNPLKDLEGFDPKTAYPYRKGIKVMPEDGPTGTQFQMGTISNLITDMTLAGAPDDHIARAVKHSMVVIDANKHKLDYQQSERDNNIAELKALYQVKESGGVGGASTLISRAKSPVYVPHRTRVTGDKGIDPETGAKVYTETGKLRPDGTPRQTRTTAMESTTDARTLVSKFNTPMEMLYANHANEMKALANAARKEILATKDPVVNKEAKSKYSSEIKSLRSKVDRAVQHQPYERKAQVLANHTVAMMARDNPSMTREDKDKARSQAIVEMRSRLGGKKPQVNITDSEWEAIQSGAVSKTTLKQIVRYADQDALKERALPRSQKGMTQAKISLAKALKTNGYTMEEIASRLGVSKSTVSKAINA
jgi:transposase